MVRSIVSVLIGASFLVLAASGVYAFFGGYDHLNIFIHVLFAWIFLLGMGFHLRNNLITLIKYLRRKSVWSIPIGTILLVSILFTSFSPTTKVRLWYESFRVGLPKDIPNEYVLYDKTTDGSNLELEILAGEHFWFPQIAVWIEDSMGNYLQTIFVTYSTSNGVFYGNRTKENFKSLDKKSPEVGNGLIRVDALPYWSHKRNVKYTDGLYTPHPDAPLVDGISGATPQSNFKLRSQLYTVDSFKVMLEVNVAFDDNEYFSEYDFPEDTMFHSGAGLLGQPSLVYRAEVRNSKKYTLMELIGHGHHSGMTGELFTDVSKITTAKNILERIIVRYEK